MATPEPNDPAGFHLPDPERFPGVVLRQRGDSDWWVRMRFPVGIGITNFDFDLDLLLDNLTTLSFVPTVELPVVISDGWTLVPFAGLGGAYQTGEDALIGDSSFLGLFRGGLRAQYWYPFGERYALLTKGEWRYDAVLERRNGLLGDWGSFDVGVELRVVLGAAGEGPRLQPGLYVQGVHYWDAVELQIDGVSPSYIDDQMELGFSVGTSEPFQILGITVPRAFVGVSLAEDLRGLRIRFGQL